MALRESGFSFGRVAELVLMDPLERQKRDERQGLVRASEKVETDEGCKEMNK